MKNRIVLLLLISLAGSACDRVTSPEPLPLRVSASIDTAQAVAGGLLSIVYKLENDTSFTLWAGSCGGQPLVAVERDENGTWVNVSADACQAHLDMTPIAIGAGGRLEGARLIDAVPGRYRVAAWGHRRTQEPGTKIYSNIVTVDQD